MAGALYTRGDRRLPAGPKPCTPGLPPPPPPRRRHLPLPRPVGTAPLPPTPRAGGTYCSRSGSAAGCGPGTRCWPGQPGPRDSWGSGGRGTGHLGAATGRSVLGPCRQPPPLLTSPTPAEAHAPSCPCTSKCPPLLPPDGLGGAGGGPWAQETGQEVAVAATVLGSRPQGARGAEGRSSVGRRPTETPHTHRAQVLGPHRRWTPASRGWRRP